MTHRLVTIPNVTDHTVLLATRHKRTHLALTPVSKAGTQFTNPGGMKGCVDLGDLIVPRPEVEPTIALIESNVLTAAQPRHL